MTKHAQALIATDLDGTLFNADEEISARTLETLEQAHHAGFTTVVVTGRSWRTCVDKLKPAKFIEHIICANGACIFQRSANTITWENTISQSNLVLLVQRLRAIFPSACFGWESPSGWAFEPDYLKLVDYTNDGEIGATAEPLGQQALYKLFFRCPDLTVRQMYDTLPPDLSQLASISTSGAPFLEATSASADKGNTLSHLAGQLGIAAEHCIAFGDNLNDLSMIAWAGTGVATANAVPELKAIANDVTLSNIDDGVAHFIEQRLQVEHFTPP